MLGSVPLSGDRSIQSGPCQEVEGRAGQKAQEEARFSLPVEGGEKDGKKDKLWHGKQMSGACLSQLPASQVLHLLQILVDDTMGWRPAAPNILGVSTP